MREKGRKTKIIKEEETKIIKERKEIDVNKRQGGKQSNVRERKQKSERRKTLLLNVCMRRRICA
jgi:hypothetical protein